MFAPPEIIHAFKGGVSAFPDYTADALITRFVAGHYITVSLSGNPERSPDLERLRDLDEMWALCFRHPRPGWRLFGRFIAKNQFVGLDLRDRHELGNSRTYEFFARLALEKWNGSIPRNPHRGQTVHDYMDGIVKDLDAPDF